MNYISTSDRLRQSAPDGARTSGSPPYWREGEEIVWQERSPTWQPGDPWDVTPVRVVRDDPAGLVVWLASGTPQLMPRLVGGAELRSLPLRELYRAPRVQARVAWRGPGILRIAPTDTPWSVWLFWSEAEVFEGWYVNLEQPHVRQDNSTWTCDHELDVWIEPDGSVQLKDSEELDAAVAANRFTTGEAELIRARADLVRSAYLHRTWYFADEWTCWRPDEEWPTPTLPAGLTWDLDLIGAQRNP